MKNIAIIGAGMAGVSAARTLEKAGFAVQIFEKSRSAGGRMATRESSYGSFDHGVQYFTIRDPRFAQAINEVPGTSEICRPWSTNAVRVLDELGRVIEAPLPAREKHFVAVPGMSSLVQHWIKPLEDQGLVHYHSQVLQLESVHSEANPNSAKSMTWTLHVQKGEKIVAIPGFDSIVFAIPNPQCRALIEHSMLQKLIHPDLVSSLQAIKHCTSVDGGVLIVPHKELYRRAKLLRWYGIDRESDRKDFRCEADIPEWGFKFHMNDVNASIGKENLKEVQENVIAKHKSNGKYYDEALKGVKGVTLLERDERMDSAYWIYSLLVEDKDKFTEHMKSCGITTSQVHERNDIHSCLSKYRTDLPNLDKIKNKLTAIPVGWWVSKEEREYIVECIKKGW